MEPEENNIVNYSKYILNEKNKLVTEDFIKSVLFDHGIEYHVNDLNIFQVAFTHKTYIINRDCKNDILGKLIRDKHVEQIKTEYQKDAVPLQQKSFETLEFLGDAVIHLILSEYLYDRYSENVDEGFLTTTRIKIENGEKLAKISKMLKLYDYVLIDRNLEKVGRSGNVTILEDIFEAFIGALYKDSNNDINVCRKFIVNIIETKIDIADLINTNTNYKDMTLRYFHKMKWNTPKYELIETTKTKKIKQK